MRRRRAAAQAQGAGGGSRGSALSLGLPVPPRSRLPRPAARREKLSPARPLPRLTRPPGGSGYFLPPPQPSLHLLLLPRPFPQRSPPDVTGGRIEAADGNHSGETGAARFRTDGVELVTRPPNPQRPRHACSAGRPPAPDLLPGPASGDGPQAALLGSPLRSALGAATRGRAHCSWATGNCRVFKPRRRSVPDPGSDPGSWGRERVGGGVPVPRLLPATALGPRLSPPSAVAQDEVEGRRPGAPARSTQLGPLPPTNSPHVAAR